MTGGRDMKFDLAIVNGKVALPGHEPAPASIAVSQGRIAAVFEAGAAIAADSTIDAGGMLVMPGVVDVHLHLGHGADISRPRVRDDALRETMAAASGGITTIIPYLMATEPFEAIFDGVKAVTEEGALVDFGYHFIISTEEQLAGVPRYIEEFGAPSFKIFMNNRGGEGKRLGLPDIDDGFLYRLTRLCALYGGMVCPHPENIEVVHVLRDEVLRADPDGLAGLATWNATRPPFVEADAVQRAALFARQLGAPLYVVHTSSALALEAARAARHAGADIHIETCPHYLTHDIGWQGGVVGKVNPPLREAADREALWQGVLDGTIDTVATDHVHRDLASKQGNIWSASPGCPGVETLLPVMLTEGVVKRGLPVSRLVRLLCEAPARIMGLAGTKGAIAPGHDADLVIVDLDGRTVPTNAATRSAAGYTIYDGWPMAGRVVHTLVRGRQVVRDGAPVEAMAGTGRYLRRRLGRPEIRKGTS